LTFLHLHHFYLPHGIVTNLLQLDLQSIAAVAAVFDYLAILIAITIAATAEGAPTVSLLLPPLLLPLSAIFALPLLGIDATDFIFRDLFMNLLF
jgi:hypothetical protein